LIWEINNLSALKLDRNTLVQTKTDKKIILQNPKTSGNISPDFYRFSSIVED